MTALLVAVGAALGAPLRYLTDRFIRARFGTTFPWGTLAVNVVGSFLLGMLMAGWVRDHLDDEMLALFGVGFCGALTTYSTFGFETLRLLEDGARWHAFGNVAGNVVAGLAAAAAGWLLIPA
ncbi:fluoride efflux transporter CrcB [Actinobacteria bacterium YIM 96077]|uniref:Fluoride-specific ion channel FluC n=1 Tax=Phytoactinopolyspora halophila TaxID=1981511 RepID=A0A329QCJ0_9ACTN|nr:fluoride efflux transporter CrcB [Phytoactinopolyspora halophila]AYY13738.1 fluoride efflux transporter CrcB [Actinobacteria bacterium YIM 96077]RAW09469.1 fluoride efflux transporter CrcB [Phytoactinopolyspora halophila]